MNHFVLMKGAKKMVTRCLVRAFSLVPQKLVKQTTSTSLATHRMNSLRIGTLGSLGLVLSRQYSSDPMVDCAPSKKNQRSISSNISTVKEADGALKKLIMDDVYSKPSVTELLYSIYKLLYQNASNCQQFIALGGFFKIVKYLNSQLYTPLQIAVPVVSYSLHILDILLSCNEGLQKHEVNACIKVVFGMLENKIYSADARTVDVACVIVGKIYRSTPEAEFDRPAFITVIHKGLKHHQSDLKACTHMLGSVALLLEYLEETAKSEGFSNVAVQRLYDDNFATTLMNVLKTHAKDEQLVTATMHCIRQYVINGNTRCLQQAVDSGLLAALMPLFGIYRSNINVLGTLCELVSLLGTSEDSDLNKAIATACKEVGIVDQLITVESTGRENEAFETVNHRAITALSLGDPEVKAYFIKEFEKIYEESQKAKKE